ncbi:MAG: hypothetical protein FJ020_09530 [Chloroflexi bacterium]|nr:hypothetical protein [Chloroflexota bacterium]
MTIYEGHCSDACYTVTKDEAVFPPVPSQMLLGGCPIGFSWGYGGSGPAQLALALLYDVTRDKDVALRHYQRFKCDCVAGWGDHWQITDEDVMAWFGRSGTNHGSNVRRLVHGPALRLWAI